MMDLVVAMAPSVDAATMTKTFELIRPYLEVRSQTVCCCLELLEPGVFLACFTSDFFIFYFFPDQGAGHAEEGVPRAGGDVWRRGR